MSENLSVSEVYSRLGLQDPDEFALKQLRRNVSEEAVAQLGVKNVIEDVRRATGCTMRRVVAAVSELSAGREVVIVGHTLAFSRALENQVRRFCDQLGISHEKLSSCSYAQKEPRLAGLSHVVVVEDHYYGP